MNLIYYPDPLLRAPKFQKVPPTQITPDLRELVRKMTSAMYAAEGVGIAAPQIGVLERVFVIDARLVEKKGDPPPLVFINPEILKTSGSVVMAEGCLSFPDLFLDIARPRCVTMRATNLEGETFTVEASGLYARALQHEFDHLHGFLMIDHVSPLQRDRAQREAMRRMRERRK